MPKLKKSAPKAAKAARVKSELGKFKRGELHSGAKDGPKVKSRKQAVAISMSESGQDKKDKKPAKAKPGKSGQTKTARKKTKSDRRPRNKGRS